MYSPVLEGDVELLPNGVAKCRGGCVISSSLLHFNEVPFVCAFSFDICALESKNTPEIQFGIKHNGLTKLDFNYFALLASIRADSLRPHIPSDGLGVPIRLLVDKTNVRLYVNEVLCPMNYALDSNSMSFYLKVQADEAIIFTPFCQEEVPQAFFPYLAPRLWSQLPWRVAIRDFTIRGTHDTIRNVFAEDELLPLPGLHGLRYFEVELRSFASEWMHFEGSLYVGLVEQPRTSTEVPPGMASRSIGISTEDQTVSVDGTAEWSGFPQEVTSGCVLGLGVQATGSILITLNGKRLNANLLSTPNFKRFIPAVATEGCASECLVNLGQRPFAFQEARPPNGWCYYTRLAPDQYLFTKGSPNGYHLLHFFPFGSPGHRTSDSHVLSKQLKENDRYELTALKPGGDDLIGIGLSDCDFPMGNMVGWDQRTLGVHTDDGMLFRENGGGGRQVIDSGNLKDGETIGLLYDRHAVKAYRNGRISDVVDDWLMQPFPTFSVKGSFIVVANFGEMPFVSDGGSDDPKGVMLYNGRQVTVTNTRSEEVGLCIGDRVEARDLSFRGTYVGEFNGYFLFMVKGLDVAIPFEETDPLLVRRMLRVVSRPKQSPMTQFGLTSNAVVMFTNKSSKAEYPLFLTPYGISVMMGRNSDSYVMRPIVDLVNNAPLFTLPISCRPSPLSDFVQTSRVRSSDGLPLDVVEYNEAGTRLMLLLGNGLAWNGSKLIPHKGKHRVYFRFFGLGFRRIQVHPTYIVNHGTRPGGQGFLPYYHGTEGTAFFQSSMTQRSYGSNGFLPVPGVVLYLLRTLNEHLLKTTSITPPPSDPPSDMSELCYDPEPDHQARHIDVPLVTESHYP